MTFTSTREYLSAERMCLVAWMFWQRSDHEQARQYIGLRRAIDASRAQTLRVAEEASMTPPIWARASTVEADLLGLLMVLRSTSMRGRIEAMVPSAGVSASEPWLSAQALVSVSGHHGAEVFAALLALEREGLIKWRDPDAFDASLEPKREPDLAELHVRIVTARDARARAAKRREQGLAALVLDPAHRALFARLSGQPAAYRARCRALGVVPKVEMLRRLIVLVGPPGSGKETLARALAVELGLQFRPVTRSFAHMAMGTALNIFVPSSGALAYATLDLPLVATELEGRWRTVDGRAEAAREDLEVVLRAFLENESPTTLVVALPTEAALTPTLRAHAHAVIQLSAPAVETQASLWRALVPAPALAADQDLDALTTLGAATPARIVQSVHRALLNSARRPEDAVSLSVDDLKRAYASAADEACHVGSERARGRSETDRMGPGLDELALAPNTERVIREIVALSKLEPAALSRLEIPGLGAQTEGLVALFEGPPGTGKTACAEAIARALNRELVSVGLSDVLGSYVGESEQNLARHFERAQQRPSVLFFDEVDGLLTRRTTRASGSHDNRLVNELLVRLERHRGLVLLATNLSDALDPALDRRVHYRVQFEPPDAATRLRLWSLYLPDSVPGAHALDRAALARDYPLTGALIRNVARRVALDAVLGLGEVSAARVIEAINAQQRGQSPGAGSDARRIGF